MVSKYRDILEPPAEPSVRASPVASQRIPPNQGKRTHHSWKCHIRIRNLTRCFGFFVVFDKYFVVVSKCFDEIPLSIH